MSFARAISPAARDAALVLGLEVARSRRQRRWTAASLAERAGISVNTLRKIERGDPTVAMGTVFDVATLVGVRLFGVDRNELPGIVRRSRDRLALLPARIYEPTGEVDDDF